MAVKITIPEGFYIDIAIYYAINKAKQYKCIVGFYWDDIEINVYPDSNYRDVLKIYRLEKRLKRLTTDTNDVE